MHCPSLITMIFYYWEYLMLMDWIRWLWCYSSFFIDHQYHKNIQKHCRSCKWPSWSEQNRAVYWISQTNCSFLFLFAHRDQLQEIKSLSDKNEQIGNQLVAKIDYLSICRFFWRIHHCSRKYASQSVWIVQRGDFKISTIRNYVLFFVFIWIIQYHFFCCILSAMLRTIPASNYTNSTMNHQEFNYSPIHFYFHIWILITQYCSHRPHSYTFLPFFIQNDSFKQTLSSFPIFDWSIPSANQIRHFVTVCSVGRYSL